MPASPTRRSRSDRAWTRAAYEAGVERRPRAHRARRHLPGQPHPTPRGAVRGRPVVALPPAADRRPVAVLRVPRPRPSPETGRPRALLSASPEPFLSLDTDGVVASDPIKGTRPRGRDRAEDRALACELLASAKDRAENVMIVDVLRNDLGRVCRPGTVRVPRLCRLERTAAVQHLVSTVTGRLAPGRDAFDLLVGELPGRLDHRRAEDPGDGDPRAPRAGAPRPVHRRARLDRGRRRDADEHPDPHVRRGRPSPDAPRRRRDHVAERPGGGMGRDVAKARGPLGAIGGEEVA